MRVDNIFHWSFSCRFVFLVVWIEPLCKKRRCGRSVASSRMALRLSIGSGTRRGSIRENIKDQAMERGAGKTKNDEIIGLTLGTWASEGVVAEGLVAIEFCRISP